MRAVCVDLLLFMSAQPDLPVHPPAPQVACWSPQTLQLPMALAPALWVSVQSPPLTGVKCGETSTLICLLSEWPCTAPDQRSNCLMVAESGVLWRVEVGGWG